MKKALSLLLILAMVLSLIPMLSVSASTNTTITIEAENMTLVTGEGEVQDMESKFPGSGFSGGKQFWFKNTAAGGVLELRFTLDTAFEGPISIAHCMAGDYGIFDVYVDNTLVYDELDMYLNAGIVGNAVQHSGNISMGEVSLAAGEHILKLVCTGKNAANTKADRYYAGLDFITLNSDYEYYSYDAAVTFEGEDMDITALANYERQTYGGDFGISSGRQMLHKLWTAGAAMKLSFTTTVNYTGEVYAAFCNALDFGIYDVYLDGVLKIDGYDAYSGSPKRDVVLLDGTGLSAGDHTIEFVSTATKNASSKGHLIAFDCLQLGNTNPPVIVEGEKMTPVITSHPDYIKQDMSADFSGSKMARYNAKIGDGIFNMTFKTDKAFIGNAYINLCEAKDYGIYDIYLDDVLMVNDFDGYNSTLIRTEVILENVELKPGSHTLKFVGQGKNASSTNYLLGVDCLTLGNGSGYYEEIVTLEAEAMTVKSGTGFVQSDMSNLGCDDFSGNTQYLSQNGAVGGEFELSFLTESAFLGYASLTLATASDFAIFDIYLDGELVIDEFDAYSTALAVKAVSLGYLELLPGRHTLKFVCTGKNASGTHADRFRIGVDCLTLGAEFDYSYEDVVGLMTDFKALALLPSDGEVGAAATSYDRVSYYDEDTDTYVNWGDRVQGATHGVGWTSNADGYGYIEAVNGDPIEGIVALDVQGSGAIFRSFFATVGEGHIKVYIDGETEPTIDMPLQDYVKSEGNYDGLGNLVYQTTARGYNNYVPITFNESCKIILCGGREKIDTNEGFWGRYFAFNYRLFGENVTVEPIRSTFTTKQKAALLEADNVLGSCGASSIEPTDTAIKTVAAGERVTALELDGTGAVSYLGIKFNDKLTEAEKLEAMQKLELSIYWDGEGSPSVWAPLGDFFGSSMGGDYTSYPMGVYDYSSFYSNWYMPYADGAKIVLENLTENDYNITFEVVSEAIDGNIADYGRFHAKWSQNRFVDEKRPYDYPVLKTEGSGRFLGFNLHIYNITEVYWWGEGDEKFFVDGEKFPSTYGTGSEDYFGYAWCSANYFNEAYHSQNSTPGLQGLPGNYNNVRFHFGDSVPFAESFVAAMEKFHSDDYTQYAATAYWYLSADGTDPYTPVAYEGDAADWRYMSLDYELDILSAPSTTNVIEGEDMAVIAFDGGEGYTGNGYYVQDMSTFPASTFSGGKQQFSGGGVKLGSEMTLRFLLKEDFNGMLSGVFCKAKDYAIIQLYLDGEALGEPIDCYDTTVINTGLLNLGEVELGAGAHELTIKVVGKSGTGYVYGIDCLVFGEHVLTYTEAVEATCTNEGCIKHWACSDCELVFSDIYGAVEIEDGAKLPIDLNNHTGDTELRNVKEATKNRDGYTGDLYCTACGNVIAAGKVIPAEGSFRQGLLYILLLYKQQFDITAEASEGGTITPAGISKVHFLKEMTYVITPNEGYEIASVLVDGVDIGAQNEYTFVDVKEAHTISASFTKAP